MSCMGAIRDYMIDRSARLPVKPVISIKVSEFLWKPSLPSFMAMNVRSPMLKLAASLALKSVELSNDESALLLRLFVLPI